MIKTTSRHFKWGPALVVFISIFLFVLAIPCICKYFAKLQNKNYSNESFVNSKSSNTIDNRTTSEQVDETIAEQEKYLIEQIQSDPNKTQLDKEIMEDLTKQYFSSSNTLPLLRTFNDDAQNANPIPGDQLIRDILRDYDRNDDSS